MRNKVIKPVRESRGGTADPRGQYRGTMETLTFSEWTMATSPDVDASIATSIMAMVMLKFMDAMTPNGNGTMLVDNAVLKNVLQESTDLIKMYQRAKTSPEGHMALTEFLLS